MQEGSARGLARGGLAAGDTRKLHRRGRDGPQPAVQPRDAERLSGKLACGQARRAPSLAWQGR